MKRIALILASTLVAAPAFAADVVYEAPAAFEPAAETPIAVSGWDWNGAYIGTFGALASSDTNVDAAFAAPGFLTERFGVEASGGGVFGGVQAGYDFQVGNFVIGGVADIALTDIESDFEVSGFGGSIGASSELEYLGTVRLRAGYALDRLLVYGHGGYAYGETKQTVSVNDGFSSVSFETDNDVKHGYVVGGGLEYAILDNVSVQTEYAYTDLGTDTILRQSFIGGAGLNVEEETDFHAVKAAVNFRF